MLHKKSNQNVLDRELLKGNFTPFSSKGLTLQTVKICKRTEIYSVSSPKFAGLGPGARQIRPISGYISTHQLHASYFQLMMPTTKLIKKIWNLPKFFLGKGQADPQEKRGNVILIYPMKYKPQVFIDEVLQRLVDKYQITYQNIWSEGVVRPHLVESSYCKTFGLL